MRLSLALGLSRLLSLVYFWDATSSGALCTPKSWQYRWWRPWNTWSTQMCAHVAMRTATLRTVQTAQNSRNPTMSYQPGRTSARQLVTEFVAEIDSKRLSVWGRHTNLNCYWDRPLGTFLLTALFLVKWCYWDSSLVKRCYWDIY